LVFCFICHIAYFLIYIKISKITMRVKHSDNFSVKKFAG